MSSDFHNPASPSTDLTLFFETVWDGTVQGLLLANVTPDSERLHRMLEGATNLARVGEFELLVDRFLEQIDPNQPLPYFGRTTFQLAAGLGSLHAMEKLITRGATVDSDALRRALYWPECVSCLLLHGADPEGTNGDWGLTCLMEACLRGLTATAAILIEHNARVDAQEIEGRTALWFSSRNRRYKCAELLLAAGANPDLPDHYGRTPLMRAKNLAIANLLLDAGADPTVKDNTGLTAYDLAGGRREFREVLVAAVRNC